LAAAAGRLVSNLREEESEMERVELSVEGMTCGGCVKSIQNALHARAGVANATADLAAKRVTIEYDPAVIQRAALVAAIEDAGFDVAA
jgi:copper chaperone